MLRVSVRDLDNTCISNISGTFDFRKRPEWFEREDVKRVIKNIDNTEVIEGECLRSPILGMIAPERLSNGCKAVVLMIVQDKFSIYATRCGDNCAPDILDIAKTKDVNVILHHIMEFPEPFEIYMVESDVVVHTMKEFINEYYKYRSARFVK